MGLLPACHKKTEDRGREPVRDPYDIPVALKMTTIWDDRPAVTSLSALARSGNASAVMTLRLISPCNREALVVRSRKLSQP